MRAAKALSAILMSLFLARMAAAAGPPARKDPFKDAYAAYRPDFLPYIWGKRRGFRGWPIPEKKMRLSSEPSFYTLNILHEDARANALVAAGLDKEGAGKYRDALKIYQLVIDKYPACLYRVSRYGIFVPVAQYCQRRILGFPPDHLAHYRTLYDPRAREAFVQARRKNSLIGLSEIADNMLATSYGGRAIVELGNAALDAGHYLAALERYATIDEFFPQPELRTPELALKTRYSSNMLQVESAPGGQDGAPPAESELTPEQLAKLRRVVATATSEKPPFHSQLASSPHRTADDYTLFPPSTDPMALRPPVWKRTLPGSRRDYFVFTQPVVTRDSVIYRHKNTVYCHSVLNGELRWTNDLGGRAVWQDWQQHQFPQEDVLVQDGRVFTVVAKGGTSLVALDEVTGQVKWAYGPMVASTLEEARIRFEAAPAGGPRTIYAGYVLDNIEGETHTDSEYGLIAFESVTGRIRWRTPLCRLAPGKFAAGFAVRRRNRIRSFSSPPLYHQGTVYHVTNAGAIAALEALSGRVKWLARYPYYLGVHDSTRTFQGAYVLRPGRRGTRLWLNQRPLIVGERLFTAPVDTAFLFCLDRRTGRTLWSKPAPGPDVRFFLGPMSTGELVLVCSGRGKRIAWYGGMSCRPVHLIDPKTGKTVWESPDLIAHEPHPVLRHYIFGTCAFVDFNRRWTEMAARPFLSSDDKLYVTTVGNTIVYHTHPGRFYTLTGVDLRARKLLGYRRYLSGPVLAQAEHAIRKQAPDDLKAHLELPHKDARVKHRIQVMRDISGDTMPENQHGPFMPFSRVTFRRYGVPFELRFGPRELSMVYDRASVVKALGGRRDTAADFAKAELAIADSRLAAASALLKRCLETISSEDLDFRALIDQQLYTVHKRLCRSAIRAGDVDAELANCLGMARTAGTLADEIETMFALSEVYERRRRPAAAARCLRSIIATYGHHEYPVPPTLVHNPAELLGAANRVIDQADRFAGNPFYGGAFARSLGLLRKGLPLYLSTVSPLDKELTVRAGELAAARLARLQAADRAFAAAFEKRAAAELAGRPPDEQLYRLWEFPRTRTAQQILTGLFGQAARRPGEAGRRQAWQLADAARVCGLTIPAAHRARVTAPAAARRAVRIADDFAPRAADLAEAEGINWLVLEREGERANRPHRLFLAGRVRKRLDNKFILRCYDLRTGDLAWDERYIRLRGRGQEPGFFKAFVCRDLVVVHGLYDVLAYGADDHALRWRYRVPFDFEIKSSVMSGDLLVLSGETESLALHVLTPSAAGEVAWQVKEMGDLYIAPYFVGDRLISVRKMPFNVTARFRATGKLIGRLDLPDLSRFTEHPLLEKGLCSPQDVAALPVVHAGRLLIVTDGWYYIAVDVGRLAIAWKRLIDANDLTREPPLRFALRDGYFAVLKQDYDQKVLWMLSSKTGEVLWHTDPKDARSPQPMHAMFIQSSAGSGGATVYGIGVHPGQAFYLIARQCKTGKLLYRTLTGGYGSKPRVHLLPRLYGDHLVVQVQDRQDFELNVYDVKTGAKRHSVKLKGVGPFGVHGKVSATIQNGRAVLLSKNKLRM